MLEDIASTSPVIRLLAAVALVALLFVLPVPDLHENPVAESMLVLAEVVIAGVVIVVLAMPETVQIAVANITGGA